MMDYFAVFVRFCVSVCAILLFQLIAWSSNVLRENGVVFDLHVRMSVVSIQMLICGLVMLAYHGCVFLYERAVAFQYHNLDNAENSNGQTEMYSTYVIEDSPRNSETSTASTNIGTNNEHNQLGDASSRANTQTPVSTQHSTQHIPETTGNSFKI